jgi:hypothetical protein
VSESVSEPPVELPHGILTFLLTDIEGSTKLWELHPAAMGAALARHEALIEATVTAHGGRLIKSQGEGDSTLSVFPRASDAVRAALGLQQALTAEAWPAGLVLRTRMALHTGEAERRLAGPGELGRPLGHLDGRPDGSRARTSSWTWSKAYGCVRVAALMSELQLGQRWTSAITARPSRGRRSPRPHRW